ncbi:hypothetical protein D9M68_778980 [compost metagenome]
MRADHIGLHVEVLQQQYKAQVGVLQLVLVARIAPHAAGMPLVPGELHQATHFKQRQDLRADHAPVQLADRIHPTAQQTNTRQVSQRRRLRINEEPAVPVFKSCQWVESKLINSLFHHYPLMTDSVEKGGFAAASRPGAPAFEVAASHFKLPFGVSLSVPAQV